MRFALLTALLAAVAAAPAAAQRDTPEDRIWYGTLREIARGCDDPVLDLPHPHVIRYRRDARELVAAMLRADPAKCPGVAAAAREQLQLRIGEPARADVDLDVLRLGWTHRVAEDPALLARYAETLWLFDDRPPVLAGRTPPAQQAVALLDARNATPELRTRRSIELHTGILLDRGSPYYDPAKAVALLEDPRANAIPNNTSRLVALLLDADHLPADYPRAARRFVSLAASSMDYSAEPQRELLRIGRLAAAAARTPADRAAALRIVAVAALDGRHGSAGEQASMLAGLGEVPRVSLAEGDALRIGRALDFQFGFDLPDRRDIDQAEMRPIILRGLIGPDGRIVATEIVQSSGMPDRDRIVRGVWASDGDKVDLSATAAGRFVWVELPPVDPLLDTYEAYRRHNP